MSNELKKTTLTTVNLDAGTEEVTYFEWDHSYAELKQLAINTLKECFPKVETALEKYHPEKIALIRKVSFNIKTKHRNKKYYGRCWSRKAYFEIYPNNFQFKHTADFTNTVLHEYAHYLDHIIHKNSGHGKTWKQICHVLGCDARATAVN